MKTITLIFLFFTTSITFAQFTAIPDPIFEQALIDLGHDDVLDGQVLTANIENVENLGIMNLGIQDLTGIEGFTSLELLVAFENEITFLDLSQNTNLIELVIDDNPLHTLIISNNPNLSFLYAEGTELVHLDTSNCPELISLGLYDSKINSLDLSQNPLLSELDVDNNFLIELDLSQNTELEQLYIGFNPFLNFLNIKNGNTSNITNFQVFQIASNHCIQVDDAAAAAAGVSFPYNIWVFDEQPIVFSEDCALSINTFANENLLFFPNPTTDKLTFVNATISYFEIYDSKGSVVLKNKNLNSNSIEVTNLTPGVYFLKVIDDKNQTQTVRFLKK